MNIKDVFVAEREVARICVQYLHKR